MLIKTFRMGFPFYKRIDQIGDVVEMDGQFLLILGIERFRVISQGVQIWFTVQDLSVDIVPNARNVIEKEETQAFTINRSSIKEKDDPIMQECYALGRIFTHDDGYTYRVNSYRSIRYESTDIVVSFFAEKIIPLSPKEVRAKLLQKKKEVFKIELV